MSGGAPPDETINTSSTSDYATGTAIVNVFSGSSYQIEHQLVGVGDAIAGGRDAIGSLVIVDALDTSASYIDVLTPGATYSTASGFDYASTPEPSTGVMVCSGWWLLLEGAYGSGGKGIFEKSRAVRRNSTPGRFHSFFGFTALTLSQQAPYHREAQPATSQVARLLVSDDLSVKFPP